MSDKTNLRYKDIVAEFNALADYGDSESAGSYISDLAQTFYAMRDYSDSLRRDLEAANKKIEEANEFSQNEKFLTECRTRDQLLLRVKDAEIERLRQRIEELEALQTKKIELVQGAGVVYIGTFPKPPFVATCSDKQKK